MYLPYRRPRLFEIHDQEWCPSEIRQQVQILLAYIWTKRVPLIQKRAVYEYASDLIERVIGEIEVEDEMFDEGKERGKLRIVDCCSGAGGPMPAIEKQINSRRKTKGQRPIPILLSDLNPHISRWKHHAQSSPSGNLSYLPIPVDATKVPREMKEDRHLRTFCLSFHHFGENSARQILEDAMRTSEGICIFEPPLPDIPNLIMMIVLWPWVLLVTPFTRPTLLIIFLTYVIPLIPFIIVFDGLISSYRTYTADHMAHIANLAAMSVSLEAGDKTELGDVVWKWEYGTIVHTKPFGKFLWAVGRRDRRGDRCGSVDTSFQGE